MSVAALSSCIVLLKRLDLPVKWLGPQQRGQGRVNIKKRLLVATLQHPLSFVTAKHKNGHSRVNRCGLIGLASRDTSQINSKRQQLVFLAASMAIVAVLFVEMHEKNTS